MNDIFCICNDVKYSWAELLNFVNKSDYYYPAYKYSNIVDFFENIVKALAHDLPITLIDSDITNAEIEAIGINHINTKVSVQSKKYNSIEDLINAIQKSQSQITLFTSGTTGQPKKVIHTPTSFIRSVRYSDNLKKAVWGFAYNPTHMAGLQVFFQAFCNQSTIVTIFNQSHNEIYRNIEQYEITHISSTPTFYRLLLPCERQYQSVVRITFGGEKSTNSLYRSIEAIFPNAKINNIYASTEAGSLFVAKGSDFQIPQNLSKSIVIESNELLLHKSLLGQSDTLVFESDFYHTGDIVEWVDKDNGIFRFLNRKKELINIGGYKVNPNEVEEIIRQYIHNVKDCVVYAKANSVLGNILCCNIVKNSDIEIKEPEIKATLSKYLQPFKVPRIIKFVDKIQYTKTGKIKRL